MNILEYRLIKKKNGKIIEKSEWKPSRSYVKNFLLWFYYYFCQQSVYAVDTTGTSRKLYTETASDLMGYVMAPSGNDGYGILVGTGTTPPTPNDYNLESKITHGTGAGQLVYGSQQETDPAATDTYVDFLLTRDFTNNSGATITVNEIGVAIRILYTSSLAANFLILRDVLTTPKDVLDGETLTVQYKLRTQA